MKTASFETGIFGEEGFETWIGFDSVPVNPSMSGRVCLSQPRTWSKERFSMTITTMVFIGPVILCFLRWRFSSAVAVRRR